MLRYVQACETKDSSDYFIHLVVKKRVKNWYQSTQWRSRLLQSVYVVSTFASKVTQCATGVRAVYT